MGYLRRIQIRSRLVIGFSLLILFTVLIGFIGILSVVKLGGSMDKALNKEVKSLTYLQRIQDSFSNVKIYLRDIALYANEGDNSRISTVNQAGMEELIYFVQDEYMNMASDVISLITLLEKYPDIQWELDQISNVEMMIENEYRHIVNQLIRAARDGENPLVLADILQQGEATSQRLDLFIGEMYAERLALVEQAQKDGNNIKQNTQFLLLLLVVFIGVFSILFSLAISHSIVSPIQKLVDVAGHIGRGDFQIQVERGYKDDIGYLSQAFATMVETVKNLIEELDGLVGAQQKGNIDVRLNEANYEGDYLLVAQGINTMVSDLSQEVALMIGCLHEFGSGNFLADIPEFPGEKVVINRSIDELRNRLIAVTEEINTLVSHCIAGDLSKRADVFSYQGDWETIVKGLNGLMDSVIAPIREASEVLKEFSQGHVDVYMKGAYKGDFDTIKKSLNTTMQFIGGYITEIDLTLQRIVSQRDFNTSIKRNYLGDFATIQKSINQIIITFNEILLEIKDTSRDVSMGAQDMAVSGNSLSQGADSQAIAVVELNRKLKELEEETNENAAFARKANELAHDARNRAQDGNVSIEQMLLAMDIVDSSSANVIKVMKVLESISTQIHLLSLNASIEAAKAGEHGRGFAVVAEQVRELAKMSQKSVFETKNIIDDTILSVKEGSQIAQETAGQMTLLIDQIHGITDLIDRIHLSSQSQASDISTINEWIDQISEISDKARQSVHASSSLSDLLAEQARKLQDVVEGFVLQEEIS